MTDKSSSLNSSVKLAETQQTLRSRTVTRTPKYKNLDKAFYISLKDNSQPRIEMDDDSQFDVKVVKLGKKNKQKQTAYNGQVHVSDVSDVDPIP